VTLWNLTVALFNAALAATSFDFKAALLTGEVALRSAFLIATTFLAALSWALMAAFLSGFFALASLALIARILLAKTFDFFVSTLLVCLLTTAVILANAALALAILALMAFF
jgi:hypothetical protein